MKRNLTSLRFERQIFPAHLNKLNPSISAGYANPHPILYSYIVRYNIGNVDVLVVCGHVGDEHEFATTQASKSSKSAPTI